MHLPSAVRAFIFFARRIQPFLSLVDREVDFLCTNDLIIVDGIKIIIVITIKYTYNTLFRCPAV